jgi:glycerol-3-phosphate O-acyltransferase
MVRDARVILSREVRHSILKITPGGNDKEAGANEVHEDSATPDHVPADSDDAALHERHVAAEHQLHQHPAASDGSAKAPD